MDAYPRFLAGLECMTPFPESPRILLAVSGGVDSLALAVLFLRWQERRRPDVELAVGHVHHGLRGAEADGDLDFVRSFARSRELVLLTEHADVASHAREHGLSIETAARDVRLKTFAEWTDRHGFDAVATGHTADDQAETIFSNIVRGSGVQGLVGMPFERRLTERATLCRPLLRVTREELQKLVADAGLAAREDSSNADLSLRRNLLRRRLIPAIERSVNPRFRGALLGLGREARSWIENRDRLLAPVVDTIVQGPEVCSIRIEDLVPVADHEPALAAVLDAMWRQVRGGDGSGLTRDHHEHWCRLAGGSTGHRYSLPHGWILERAAGWIHLLQPPRAATPSAAIPLLADGRTTLSWCGMEIDTHVEDDGRHTVRLPGRWVERGIALRAARPGDRIAVGTGHGEVKELLRAWGIPPSLRWLVPVGECDGEVVWIPGLRVAVAVAADGSESPPSKRRAAVTVNRDHGALASVLAALIGDD